MKISRVWAMPDKETFSIYCINHLVKRFLEHPSIDPFCNGKSYATFNNDLNPDKAAESHLDAYDFLRSFDDGTIQTILFDPPYSPRQVSESYKALGKSVNTETTSAAYWRRLKTEIARVCIPGGICISCGWNSGGIGVSNRFEIVEILLVPHGGAHNDTIVTVERKVEAIQPHLF
tara:strand:+ start:1376 stop:1900 length:525 start_codon:yes stop_codon:yes gene_type:complete